MADTARAIWIDHLDHNRVRKRAAVMRSRNQEGTRSRSQKAYSQPQSSNSQQRGTSGTSGSSGSSNSSGSSGASRPSSSGGSRGSSGGKGRR